MRFTVWGSRGSHPTVLTPAAIQSKIATVVQRIRPIDLVSQDARERFLASLPEWLFGSTSGNTACVQLELNDSNQLVFDAGSGIIGLGQSQKMRDPAPMEYHLFFTHFHYDHIQGLPFFVPAYNPQVEMHFYSPLEDLHETLSRQMIHPYFPVTMDGTMGSKKFFHKLTQEGVELYGARVIWRELNHPGRAFGYRVDYGGRSFGYITDVELLESDFEQNRANARVFSDLDVLILDAQYTLDEAIEKINWGHSSFSLAVDFAKAWNTRRLFLFHHEPQYNDRKLEQNLQAARRYAVGIKGGALDVYLAREGTTIDV
ncbi:MAG: MBL fold metallo-hydrolase [Spirochaetaceae bacterium]|nr:MAG: MBL fold metallo-hydrolase [Spirochaetaceae bacterium]